jgi:hypothetical protein
MEPVAVESPNSRLRGRLSLAQRVVAVVLTAWAFVYVFFSNGTPFDAPNRSETCSPS